MAANFSNVVGQGVGTLGRAICNSLDDRIFSRSTSPEAMNQDNQGNDNLGFFAEGELEPVDVNHEFHQPPIEVDPESLLPVPPRRNFMVAFAQRIFDHFPSKKWVFVIGILLIGVLVIGSLVWFSNQKWTKVVDTLFY